MSGQPLWGIFLAPNKTKREQVDLYLDENVYLDREGQRSLCSKHKRKYKDYYESKK